MMDGKRTTAEIYKRLDVLKLLNKNHKKMFAAIAKEAKLLRDPSEKETKKTPHAVAKKMASQRGRGPQAIEWLKEKIDEAAMLRERFADFNSNPEDAAEATPSNKCTPHEIITVGDDEVGYNKSASKLMRVLGFTAPSKGKVFWVIPPTDAFSASKLKEIIAMLKNAQDEGQIEKEEADRKKKKKKSSGFVVGDDEEEEEEVNNDGKENEDNNKVVLEADSEDDKKKKKEKKEKEKRKLEKEKEKEKEVMERAPESEEEEEEEEEEEGDGTRRKSKRVERRRRERRKQVTGKKRSIGGRDKGEKNEGDHEGNNKEAEEAEEEAEEEDAATSKRRRLKKKHVENETNGTAESLDIAPPLSAEGVINTESMEMAPPVKAGDELDDIFESQQETIPSVVRDDESSDEEEVVVKKGDKRRKKMVEVDEEEV